MNAADPTIPHYYDDEWTWVRGVSATIDRVSFLLKMFKWNTYSLASRTSLELSDASSCTM